LRSGRRAGGWAGGSAAGAGRVAGRGNIAGRGRGAEATLPRGSCFPISRVPRSATAGELPAGSTRRRDTDAGGGGGGGGRVSRGRARGSQQRAGSTAVGLRREDLRRDQRDVRQRIRRRDGRGAPIGRLARRAFG